MELGDHGGLYVRAKAGGDMISPTGWGFNPTGPKGLPELTCNGLEIYVITVCYMYRIVCRQERTPMHRVYEQSQMITRRI